MLQFTDFCDKFLAAPCSHTFQRITVLDIKPILNFLVIFLWNSFIVWIGFLYQVSLIWLNESNWSIKDMMTNFTIKFMSLYMNLWNSGFLEVVPKLWEKKIMIQYAAELWSFAMVIITLASFISSKIWQKEYHGLTEILPS